MINRRRSERFPASLSVWLKDAQGGEHTRTVNVSSHGIAVFSTRDRPLRQYVELEISLPEPINRSVLVTAMVARHADEVSEGAQQGLGLDFFLFDAKAKDDWQFYLRLLRDSAGLPSEPESAEAPARTPPRRPPSVPAAEIPTFLIKPRDLGRLWAFYRGELARGRVRIESPVPKAQGSLAELLVVHPTTESEWILQGRVDECTTGRSGRPVLQIGLDGLTPQLKADFRSYVSTGQGMIEEEVPLSMDIELPSKFKPDSAPAAPSRGLSSSDQRLESVVLDLDDLDEPIDLESPVEDPTVTADSLIGSDNLDRPSPSVLPGLSHLERPEKAHTPPSPPFTPVPRSFLGIELPDELDELDSEAETPRPELEVLEPDLESTLPAPSSSASGMPVFASFFAEAKASSSDLLDPAPEPEPIPLAEPVFESDPAEQSHPDLPEGFVMAPAPNKAEPPPVPRSSQARPLSNLNGTSAPPPLPASKLRNAPLTPPPAQTMPRSNRELSVQVGPAEPDMKIVTGEPEPLSRNQGLKKAEPPPARPGIPVTPMSNYFEGEPSVKVSVQPVSAPRGASQAGKGASPVSAATRRAAMRRSEDVQASGHRFLSTAGTNPALDRDIALARARVVRTPRSATATYRLGALLLQRGHGEVLDEALNTLQKVLEIEAQHPGAHAKLAELRARKGEYQQAFDHLQKARKLGHRVDPDLEKLIQEGMKRV